MTPTALVGREHELATLAELAQRAAAGAGGAALVVGEPGVGKSALVAAAASAARSRGMAVLPAACWSGTGAPGYWPWVQVTRGLARGLPGPVWAELLAANPQLRSLLDPGTPGAHPAPDDFALQDALTAAIVTAARYRPVLVVVEDAQWADAGSLGLARFLVQHTRLEPVLLVTTVRDEGDPEELARVLASLPPTTPMRLAGLSPAEVAVLVDRVVDRVASGPVDPDLLERIVAGAGGNPLFVEQAAALWLVGGSLHAIPGGLREVIERRVARLPSRTVALLEVAAIWGPEVDVPLAAATAAGVEAAGIEAAGVGMAGRSDAVHTADAADAADAAGAARSAGASHAAGDSHPAGAGPSGTDHEFLAGVQPALQGGLLRADGEDGLRFVHDLVREWLLEQLAPRRAQRLHAAAARAGVVAPWLADRVPASQRADHAHLAGPELGVDEALPILVRAAQQAAARAASEESVRHYARALDRLPTDHAQRGAVLLALADQQRRAGTLGEAAATYQQALATAARTGDLAGRAKAAIGLHELGHALDDEAAPLLLDGVLALLLADPGLARTGLTARVMAAAGRERAHLIGADRDLADRLTHEAVALARTSGDEEALALCLVARHDAIWAAATAPERLAVADELVEVGRRRGAVDTELLGRHLRVTALLELGDPRALDEHAVAVSLGDRVTLPRSRYTTTYRQAALDTLAGRFEDGQRVAGEAAALGRRLGEATWEGVLVDQLWALARVTGRTEGLEPVLRELRAAGDPHLAMLDLTLALDRGDQGGWRRYLPKVVALSRVWPRWAELMWPVALAQIAVASGDPDLGIRTRTALAPYRDRWVVLGGSVLVDGPVSHWLALLDIALSDWTSAVADAEAAEAAALRLDALPWVGLARADLAEALLGRGAAGDDRRAARLLELAAATATDLGMAPLARRIAVLRATLPAPPAESLVGAVDGRAGNSRPDPSLAPGDAWTFDGGVWTLGFRGRITLMPDAKGLHDLAVLLASPGVEITARDLLGVFGHPELLAADLMRADPVIDEAARRAYRARVHGLDEAIADALGIGDDDQAARLDEERSALLVELGRTTGLGGRQRRLGDTSERARKAVTGRIRDVIRRIGERDPDLAEHLRATVTTGTTCCYRPAEGHTWST